MKINEIIIMNTAGVTLFYQNFGTISRDVDSFTGLLAALKIMATTVMGGDLKSIQIENLQYNFFSFDLFTLVIQSEEYRQNEIFSLAENIGLMFNANYGKYIDDAVDTELFDPFSEELDKILSYDDKTAGKPRLKSSEMLANFLGIKKGNLNIKRILSNL